MKSIFQKFKRVAFALVLVPALTLSLNAKDKSSIDKIKDNGKVRIGVFSDKAPFGYLDSYGKHQGFDIVIAKRLTKELLGDENKVEFINLEAANRVEYLVTNKVDIVLANFTVTRERAKKVDFANPEIETLSFDHNSESFAALKDKRGAALTHDNTLLFAWAKQNEGFEVGIDTLGPLDTIAPAVKKGNKDLLLWINQTLEKLGEEKFIENAYNETLKPIYGDSVKIEFRWILILL